MIAGRSVGSVSPELLGVTLLPVASDRWSLLNGLVSLVLQASAFLSGGSETAELSVLHLSRGNPVNTGVTADGLVRWVSQDDFEEFE